jgi:quinol monooxygenase YgiN
LVVIIGILRISVAEGLRFEAASILRSLKAHVLSLPGCRDYIIREQEEPESAVVLIEVWESQQAFEAQFASEEYGHIVSAVKLSECSPEAFCGSRDNEYVYQLGGNGTHCP